MGRYYFIVYGCQMGYNQYIKQFKGVWFIMPEEEKELIKQSLDKNFTWQQIVDMFPDRWVAVSDGIYDGADILSGILRAVCTEKTLTEETLRVYGRGIKVHWRRTTPVDKLKAYIMQMEEQGQAAQ